MSYTYINGKLYSEGEAKISVKDRGFRFGDGAFETLRVQNSKIYRFEDHILRLKRGLRAIEINYNFSDIEEIAKDVIKKNNLVKGILRISITRGEGSRGYMPTSQASSSIVIEAIHLSDMELNDVKLNISEVRKIPSACIPSGNKLMQGLNYSLVKMAAKQAGFFDSIMLTVDGFISECSSSNIFWAKGGEIFTPSDKMDCVAGIIRKAIIEDSQFKVNQGEFSVDDLKGADEIFVSNISIKLLQVQEVEGLFVSDGKDEAYSKLSDFIERDINKFCN